MTPEQWFDWLQQCLDEAVAESAGLQPAEGDVATSVTGAERELLLDVARIAAHNSERWAAPISTYLIGCKIADVPASVRQRVVEVLVAKLETRDGASDG